MHFARLVKQASGDLVSDLFVYYRLGCEPFVCSWGLHGLVSKTDNVMHFARLVKQASVDLVYDQFV